MGGVSIVFFTVGVDVVVVGQEPLGVFADGVATWVPEHAEQLVVGNIPTLVGKTTSSHANSSSRSLARLVYTQPRRYVLRSKNTKIVPKSISPAATFCELKI